MEKENLVFQQEKKILLFKYLLQIHIHQSFFFYTRLAYKIKAHKIPEGTAASKGKSILIFYLLKSHHSISSIMPLPEDETEWKNLMVVFATSKGNVRKNTLEDFVNINNSGKIAMKLDQDDKIIGVKICKEDEDILLSTQLGKCIRFKSKKLRLFKGRSSKGIKGIQLADKDKVISLSIIENSKLI